MKIKNYVKYFKGVCKHKWLVLKECYNYGILWRGIWHDMSKFSISEFGPYARYWIQNDGNMKGKTQEVQDQFRIAWQHHANHNPHHPGYWINNDYAEPRALRIPIQYVYEMVADWIACSIEHNNGFKQDEPLEYYKKNLRDNYHFHMATKIVLDMMMVDFMRYDYDFVILRIRDGYYEDVYDIINDKTGYRSSIMVEYETEVKKYYEEGANETK